MLQTILDSLGDKLSAGEKPIPCFKQALTEARSQLASRFEASMHTDVDELVLAHSNFMDGLLSLAWQRFDWIQSRSTWRKSRISLIAVGGYGRHELLPNSDIDLLILLERNNHRSHRENIQSFTTLLWDIGLEVGHSVRSLSECRQQAANDVTVLTAMMESRTIVGDEELLEKMNARIAATKIWSIRDFYLAKKAEQVDRHEKSNHTEYSLEPNVKSSPGGLRDIQTLAWVARRQYGTRAFRELARQQVLTHEEAEELISARSYLWKIRFALHLLIGKDENRLLFDYQPKLAQQFGFVDGDQLAVEQFMQSYYRTAHTINSINDMLLQHFEETIVNVNKRLQVKPVNDRFRLVNNQLETTSDSVFQDTPSALIEMFVLAGSDESIKGFRASTMRLARSHVDLIDEAFRKDKGNAELFMKVLGSKSHLFTQLRRMARWGILGAYLPEFGRVIGQMQFDLFHIYTVDAHTLQVVRNMRRFRYKNNEQQFPVAAHIHPRLPRIELLYIAGLYHDIAKGMGGDHSKLGIDIARDFCERHGLTSWDTSLVCWLVENHLVMSTTAQRKDIQDPEVIHEFAEFVGEKVRLDYLYALTVADINATNPTLWNGWRASLMRQLYSETKKALRHGLENPMDRHEYVQDIQQQAINRLVEHGIEAQKVTALWNQVDDEYFVRERLPDIVWHAQEIIGRNVEDGPIILIQDDTTRGTEDGYTQIFIHTYSRKDLFLSIVSAIDQLGLDIVDARIATSAGNLTFDTFTVLDAQGHPLGSKPSRIEKVISTIASFLKQDDISLARSQRTPRVLKQFKQKSQVSIEQDPHLPLSVLEIISPDRPGLLAVIANVFMQLGVSLVSARITTLGERVEDLFYITDAEGKPITDEKTVTELNTKICEALDNHVQRIAS